MSVQIELYAKLHLYDQHFILNAQKDLSRKRNAEIARQNWDQGLGTSHKQQPICAKFPPAIDAILRDENLIPDRSAYIRAAVEHQLKEDGLL